MAYFTWTSDLAVNEPRIDAQHQRLFVLAEELFEAMQAGAGKDVLNVTLRNLITYTETHFRDEERLMAQRGFPGLAAHQREHTALTRKVREFQTRYAGGNAHITIELMQFLKSWLETHIKQEDKRWAACVPAGR